MSLAASFMGGASGAFGPLAAGVGATRSAPFYKMFHDPDHPDALDFGRSAAAAGQAVQAIGGDVTALWYDDLFHRWREGQAAIAGLTCFSVAMCLELMAWDAGLRTLFRAEHAPMTGGGARHAMTGPPSMLAHAPRLYTGMGLGEGTCALFHRCPSTGGARSTRMFEGTAPTGRASDEILVSWIFAPRRPS